MEIDRTEITQYKHTDKLTQVNNILKAINYKNENKKLSEGKQVYLFDIIIYIIQTFASVSREKKYKCVLL